MAAHFSTCRILGFSVKRLLVFLIRLPMKSLLTALAIGCISILPVAQVNAAPAAETATTFAPKTYGGFKPGKKFSFKVTKVISTKMSLGGKPQKTTPPKGIPKFKKGQKVKFTIGKKGELKGPGFSLTYKGDGGSANAYANAPKKGATQGDVGEVFKINSNNKPTGVALTFFKVELKGFVPTVYSVNYILE